MPDNLDVVEDGADVSEELINEAMEYLYLASQMDVDTCVKRLICHVNDPNAKDFQSV